MRILLAMLIMLLVAPARAETTVRYTVLFQGKPSGAQVTRVADDGSVTVDFSYRNNGRGPDLKEEFALAKDGTLVRYSMKGTSTFGAPVHDSFTRRDGHGEWKSQADRGSTTGSGSSVYVPVESSPEVLMRIVLAVALQPGQRLAALPAGELAVEKVADERLELAGKTRELSLYVVTGMYIEPIYFWATRGPESTFFAWILPGWGQVIESGWESLALSLELRQVEADTRRLHELAGRLRHRLPSRSSSATHASSMPKPRARAGAGRVRSRRPHRCTLRDRLPAQEVATVLEARGRVLLPGLFDMHGHEMSWNAAPANRRGRDDRPGHGQRELRLAELSRGSDRGEILGPRIVPAGFIEGESDFSARHGFVVSDLEGVKKAIDWYAQRGYPQIKIYNSFRPEWVSAATQYAHQRGLRVSGHVPAFMRAEDAVRQGFDEIQHINQVLLNFFGKPKDDTRTLARFPIVAENAHGLNLDAPEVRDLIALLRQGPTVIDPTLACFEGQFVQLQGEMNPSYASIAAHLPAAYQRFLRTNSMDVNEANVDRYRKSFAKMVEFTGMMHRAGIPLVAGTDAVAGFTLHRELELYVQAGIPPGEALRIATWNGASTPAPSTDWVRSHPANWPT